MRKRVLVVAFAAAALVVLSVIGPGWP